MKRLALVVTFSVTAVLGQPLPAATTPPPNFVFVLGEGHGWSSTSVQMDDAVPESRSAFVRTPNLEKLAQGGMRFANFYAPSPRCTPSRVSFFTGKSPAQLRMTFINEGRNDSGSNPNGRVLTPSASLELPTSETTLAEVLQRAGYATAHFGKWHMGRADPCEHGFAENDGPNGNGGPDNVANPHPKQLYGMTEHGLDFMSRQVKAGKPFCLQLSHYASRQGGDASRQALAAVKGWGGSLNERELAQAAADFDLDLACGMVLRKLDGAGNRRPHLRDLHHGPWDAGPQSPVGGWQRHGIGRRSAGAFDHPRTRNSSRCLRACSRHRRRSVPDPRSACGRPRATAEWD